MIYLVRTTEVVQRLYSIEAANAAEAQELVEWRPDNPLNEVVVDFSVTRCVLAERINRTTAMK